MPGREIVSHYVAFIYEIRSRATQFNICTRSDTIAFYLPALCTHCAAPCRLKGGKEESPFWRYVCPEYCPDMPSDSRSGNDRLTP